MHWKLALGFGLAVLVAVVFAQNTQVVEVRFLFWKLAMSRVLLLLTVLGTGFVLGWLAATLPRLGRKD